MTKLKLEIKPLAATTLAILDVILHKALLSPRQDLFPGNHDIDPCTTLNDLWMLSVLRCTLLVVTAFGLSGNFNVDLWFTKKSVWCIGLTTTGMATYALVKPVFYVPIKGAPLVAMSLWVVLGLSFVFSVLLYPCWLYLGGEQIDFGPEDDDVDDDDDDDEEKERKKRAKERKYTAWEKLTRLIALCKPEAKLMTAGLVCMCVCLCVDLLYPYIHGQMIQAIIGGSDMDTFLWSLSAIVVTRIVSGVSFGIRDTCFHTSIERLNNRLRKGLFASIVHQEIGFFDTKSTGDISSRLASDTTIMGRALSDHVISIIRLLIKGVGLCFIMFFISWRLSLITIATMPIITAEARYFGRAFKKFCKKTSNARSKANEVAQEVISSVRTVRSFANEEIEVERYGKRLDKILLHETECACYWAVYFSVNETLPVIVNALTTYFGVSLVSEGELTGGSLVAFILYQERFSEVLHRLADKYSRIMEAMGAADKVFEYTDRKPDITPSSDLKPETVEGKIEFRNVSFAYPTRKETPILKNVSFTVQPGELVALVGPSGSGKSSCIGLLQHFYDADEGEVLLDGVPINQYDHHFFHTKVSLVAQEPVLYARSLKDNITYGMADQEMTTVERVAKMANAHEFIDEMEKSYETQAGERGVQLSGGQKQRVAIARAVIREPSVLLLDEATSALDTESERIVQNAIQNNLGGRTVVMIAHRLSTVENADRIIAIDKGKVVEEGTHKELMKIEDGLYARLVKQQMLHS